MLAELIHKTGVNFWDERHNALKEEAPTSMCYKRSFLYQCLWRS